MRQLRSYIVRIYRQGFDRLWGTVEDAETGFKRSFSNAEEMWTLLHGPIRAAAGRAGRNPSKEPSKQEK